jgi:hypothetical protein
MTKRLKHIAPLQCGIVLAALYGIVSLIFVPFILLFSLLGAQSENAGGIFAGGLLFVVLIPVLYAIGGFLLGLIAAAAYNLIVRLTGGFEFTVADAPPRLA